jgi:hypothetical protein
VIGHNLGSGPGMVGYSDTTGIGVYGINHGAGVGVRAENTSSGAALQVSGPAVFSRSGLVSIAAGLKSATVTGVAMTATSLVLATVQNNAGASVANAVPTIPGTSLTITLNKAVPTGKTAKVAWFVVN